MRRLAQSLFSSLLRAALCKHSTCSRNPIHNGQSNFQDNRGPRVIGRRNRRGPNSAISSAFEQPSDSARRYAMLRLWSTRRRRRGKSRKAERSRLSGESCFATVAAFANVNDSCSQTQVQEQSDPPIRFTTDPTTVTKRLYLLNVIIEIRALSIPRDYS